MQDFMKLMNVKELLESNHKAIDKNLQIFHQSTEKLIDDKTGPSVYNNKNIM
jgi:hypothetical protein